MVRLIDGTLIPFTENYVIVEGRVNTNPTQAQMKAAGWKPLEVMDEPEYDDATHCLVPIYEERDDAIWQSWKAERRDGK